VLELFKGVPFVSPDRGILAAAGIQSLPLRSSALLLAPAVAISSHPLVLLIAWSKKLSDSQQMYTQMLARAIPGASSSPRIGQPFGGYFLIDYLEANQKNIFWREYPQYRHLLFEAFFARNAIAVQPHAHPDLVCPKLHVNFSKISSKRPDCGKIGVHHAGVDYPSFASLRHKGGAVTVRREGS
jgi:hypothetical protein